MSEAFDKNKAMAEGTGSADGGTSGQSDFDANEDKRQEVAQTGPVTSGADEGTEALPNTQAMNRTLLGGPEHVGRGTRNRQPQSSDLAQVRFKGHGSHTRAAYAETPQGKALAAREAERAAQEPAEDES